MRLWSSSHTRPISLAIASCVLTASAGCISAEQRANERQSRVSLGMTQEEVHRMLGPGAPWWTDDGVEGETWHYSYGTAPDPAKIAAQAALITVAIALTAGIALLLAYGGGRLPETINLADGPGKTEEPSGRIHFFVYFDPTGRVRKVSGMSPCHDP